MLKSKKNLCILGIETSCDETAVALMDTMEGLVAHNVFSQVSLSTTFGF